MVNIPNIQSIPFAGSFLCTNSVLKMIYHPDDPNKGLMAGVIRPVFPTDENPREYAYDYFIKDYTSAPLSAGLGNVRVVLTEEDATYTKKFLTTLEVAHRAMEEDDFDNISERAADLPTGYPVDGSVELNEKIPRNQPLLFRSSHLSFVITLIFFLLSFSWLFWGAVLDKYLLEQCL